jgi:hypothetical protein
MARKHFDIGDWTDFARGCALEPHRAAMEAHLASGCRGCRATVGLVQRIVAATRHELSYEPPADVVRCAKAISALARTRSSSSRLAARLIYDSVREPMPAGMRAEDRLSRHALYDADGFFLDLRIERESGSPLMTLVGQLTDRANPESALSGGPVLLMTRKDIVAHAVCNRFGEFQMDYPPTRNLRLCVALGRPGKRLEVSLNRLASEIPGDAEPATHRARPPRKQPTGRNPTGRILR